MLECLNLRFFENANKALEFMEVATKLDKKYKKSRSYTLIEIANGYLVETLDNND